MTENEKVVGNDVIPQYIGVDLVKEKEEIKKQKLRQSVRNVVEEKFTIATVSRDINVKNPIIHGTTKVAFSLINHKRKNAENIEKLDIFR
ncbi:CLUMA_CG010227, isoform A [Clunio marinus]|uniref:CLUMA_CG010227, isoform A n=1 Tax=Clunio marinus TaxID=568069 RepID=A0A1J1I8Q1_9DIPT|nr:CLUMA_CG010227, isoform A [Clunio marinus]